MTFLSTIEAIFSPAKQEAIAFAEALETDVEGAEDTAITAGFTAAVAAYGTTAGSLEAKAIAALEALGTSLLGEAVTVVKAAATTAAEAPAA